MNMDGRPRLAVGHVSLEVEDVGEAYAFFVRHGMRDIFRGEDFGVLELRGGSHLVLSRAKAAIEPGREAPFDLMVDDIDACPRGIHGRRRDRHRDQAWTNPRHLPHRRSERLPIRGDLLPRGRPRGVTFGGRP